MTPLERYRAATEEWRRANAATQAATRQRGYALADMAATMSVTRVARAAGLSVASVERLIAKARNAHEGDTDA